VWRMSCGRKAVISSRAQAPRHAVVIWPLAERSVPIGITDSPLLAHLALSFRNGMNRPKHPSVPVQQGQTKQCVLRAADLRGALWSDRHVQVSSPPIARELPVLDAEDIIIPVNFWAVAEERHLGPAINTGKRAGRGHFGRDPTGKKGKDREDGPVFSHRAQPFVVWRSVSRFATARYDCSRWARAGLV
jgi:hypothetical protein